MRCLALSEELIKRKHQVYFFSKIQDKELIDKIKNHNITFKQIDKELSMNQELKLLIEYLKQEKIDWVITDHYKLNEDYIKKIKDNHFKVLSIDDTAKLYYHSDIVLNQNIGSEKLNYSSEDYTRFLLGSKYIMLRDEIIKEKNEENKTGNTVLITFGGSDSDNFSLKILKILDSRFDKLKYIVVTGPLNPFYKEIKKYTDSHQNVSVFKSPKNMAEIYKKSDISISAGGSTCYELAYYGIPNIIIYFAENQKKVSEELDNNNISFNLGYKDDYKEETLIEKINKLINDKELKEKMSKNGKKIVDGKGKQRIVDYLERFN